MNKELKNTIKFFKKNKGLILKTIIPVVIFCLLVTIIGILLPKPNDNISPSNRNVLFENRNPRFKVAFGKEDNPDTSYVRFEAKADTRNPFDEEKSNIWNSFTRAFTSRKGFEFGLSEIRFSETESDLSKKLIDQIGEAIEQMEVKDVKTGTEVIEVGRLLGETDENNISKKTVLNKDVYPGVDVEYQILENLGVKEEIIIQNIDEYTANCGSDSECLLPLNEFVFDLKLDDGLSLERYESVTKEENTPTYYLVDDNDNYIAHFLPTFAVDGVGSKTYAVDLVINHIEESNYEVVVTMDLDWLFSSDRVFPIRIDPSIVHDTTTEFDTGSDYNTEVVTGPKVKLQEAEIDYVDSNVVGYWKLDEASGTGAYLLDSSGNGNHGTPTGTSYEGEGVLGGARSFNGSSDYIDLPSGFANFTSGFSVDLWAMTTSNGSYERFIDLGETSGSGSRNILLARVGTSNDLGLWAGNGTSFVSISATDGIINNEWHHYAGTIDASGMGRIYRDGKLLTSGQLVVPQNTSRTNNYIGRSNWAGDAYFSGLIDEVRISNIARPADEIERLYQIGYEQKIQGAHTSASIDMESNSDIEGITWTSVGNHTGDGETPYSTTGLVGQWNFNETSGTTADNEGSCGSSCDGTLTNFSNTTGQDVVAGSGWTSDNRRWGDGALMFDGTDDYVNAGTNSALNIYNSGLTMEAWIKTSYTPTYSDAIMQRMENAIGSSGYSFEINSNGTLSSYYYYSGSGPMLTGNTAINDGQWHHIVATFSSTDYAIYIDGNIDVQETGSYPTSGSIVSLSFNIGKFSEAPDGYFSGAIDSVRVYSRALTPNEIFSNYQSGNIEMRYRTSDDGSTWSDWSGTETSVEDFDDNYLYDTTTTGLVSYWPMDEDSGTTVDDPKGSNNGTAYGSYIVDGKFGNSRAFDGSNDYIEISNHSSLQLSSNFTWSAWIYRTVDTGGWERLMAKSDSSGWDYFMQITDADTLHCGVYTTNSNVNQRQSLVDIPVGEWTHVTCALTSSYTWNVYVNGVISNGTTSSSPYEPARTSTKNLQLGRLGDSSTWYYTFKGQIDEFQIYNTELSSSVIRSLWAEGSSNPSIVRTESISNSIEGDNSLSIESNGSSIDGNTVGYWKLDESSGTGAYLKDSSPNGNDGTPTGTTFVKDGKIGGAREFDGSSSEYITIGDTGENIYSFDLWVYFDSEITSASTCTGVFAFGANTGQYSLVTGSCSAFATSETLMIMDYDSSIYHRTYSRDNIDSGWHHIAFSWNGEFYQIYLDGESQVTYGGDNGHTNLQNFSNLVIGESGSNDYFTGKIDELRIHKISRTSEEIYESYMLGKDKYISKSIDTVDLSSNTTLPFWIASDEIGSNMDLMYGESEYANYQPDENTVGYWSMDREGPESQVSDLSGNGNHGGWNPNGFRYTRYDNACTSHPTTHTALINCFNEGTLYANTSSTTSQSATNIAEDYTSMYSTWMYVSEPGSWLFAIDGDDAVEIEVNGTVVASYYDGHGFSGGQTHNGSISLDNGWHKVNIRHEEVAGGDGVVAYVRPPGVGTWSVFNTTNVEGYATLHSYNASNTEVQLSQYITGGLQSYPSGSFVEGFMGDARSFNGSSDYVNLGDDSSLGPTDLLTVDFWIKTESTSGGHIVDRHDETSGDRRGYIVYLVSDGRIMFSAGSGGSYPAVYSTESVNDGKWHHVVSAFSANRLDIYIDGKLSNIETSGVPSTISSPTRDLILGRRDPQSGYGPDRYFNGGLDEVRISNIARTPTEIRQAYEVGRRTHPIKVNFKADLESSNLITGDSDKSFTISEQDYGTSDHIENIDVGEKIIVRENIDGTQYIAQGEIDTINTSTGALTVSSWDSGSTFPTSGFTVNATVFKWQREYIDVRSPLDEDINQVSRLTFRKKTDVPATFWIDDVKKAAYMSDGNVGNTEEQVLGFNDDVSNRDSILKMEGDRSLSLSDTEVYSKNTFTANDISGYDKLPFWIASDQKGYQSSLLLDGSTDYANYIPDTNTVGYWKMDEDVDSIVPDDVNLEGYWDFSESSGTGAYLTDKSSNSNDGTPSGTTYTDGVITGGREFNGSSDYVTVPRDASLEPNIFTVEAWVKPDATQAENFTRIVDKAHTDGDSKATYEILMGNTSTPMTWWGTIRTTTGGYQGATSSIDMIPNEWNHVAITFDGSTLKGYTNGVQSINLSITGSTPDYDSGDLSIGYSINYDSDYFAGEIDEVGIYSSVLSSAEIEDRYDEGREIKDYSGNDYHGVRGGTNSTNGRVSNAREFDGSSNYVKIGDLSTDIYTITGWFYNDDTFNGETPSPGQTLVAMGGSYFGVRFGDASANATDEIITVYTNGGFSAWESSTSSIDPGWHFLAAVWNGSIYDIYLDGIQVNNKTYGTNSLFDGSSIEIGRLTETYSRYFNGSIDEVRISNSARTSTEIYESYNIGKRMLQPEIKFKADLQSSNLISDSSDKSFDISEIAYDTTDDIENIESGDKIIITEDTYKAQATVDTVNTSTGAVTVEVWDEGSTFPTGGYTTSAKVFKWQKEYLHTSQVDQEYLTSLDQITMITSGQANIWYDDVRAGEEFAYIEQAQYVQYQPIFTRWDDNPLLDLYLTEVAIDYTSGPTMDQVMRHGKWFNSSGEKQPFWWVGEN